MANLIATIFTKKNIADKETALEILNSLIQAGFSPEKIGTFEPLKTIYNVEEYVRMWTEERPGCYEDKIGMTGKAGGIILKTQQNKLSLYVNWWNCPNKLSINVINFYFKKQTFKSNPFEIEKLFKETIEIVNGLYGYISESNVEDRQHVTGTLETRIPGIFWCNYFSESFIEFFSKERIEGYPWWKIEEGFNNGLYLYLMESPIEEIIKDDSYERKAKNYLGRDSFGDVEKFLEYPDLLQIKRVPKM